jgi:hypothetical protein
VARLRRGEAAAVGQVYDCHHAAVRAFARRLLGDAPAHGAAALLVGRRSAYRLAAGFDLGPVSPFAGAALRHEVTSAEPLDGEFFLGLSLF